MDGVKLGLPLPGETSDEVRLAPSVIRASALARGLPCPALILLFSAFEIHQAFHWKADHFFSARAKHSGNLRSCRVCPTLGPTGAA